MPEVIKITPPPPDLENLPRFCSFQPLHFLSYFWTFIPTTGNRFDFVKSLALGYPSMHVFEKALLFGWIKNATIYKGIEKNRSDFQRSL